MAGANVFLLGDYRWPGRGLQLLWWIASRSGRKVRPQLGHGMRFDWAA